MTYRTIVTMTAALLLSVPAAVEAAYISTVAGGTATMTGDASGDTLTITQAGGLFRHNRFAAGDGGFNSEFDFDSGTAGDQTVSSSTGVININAGDGNDTIALGDGIDVRSAIDGGPGTDTIDYAASTTAIYANLGFGTTGLSATLGADQENPPTTGTATATATVTNYSIVTHTFDITVVVTGLLASDVTGFHIHRAPVGVNGPIIVDFTGVAPLVPSGTGFTFTATGLTLPSANEAAFLGGGTYVNIHTAAFPAGAIRGQLFSGDSVNLASGAATATTSVTNVENATGGSGGDSLVGNSGVNVLAGGAGADWIVGGAGNDTLTGGAGSDVLVSNGRADTDVMEGGPDSDTVQVNGTSADDALFARVVGTRLGISSATLGVFALDIGTVETVTFNGLSGNDSFWIDDLSGVASLTTLNENGWGGDDWFGLQSVVPAGVAVNVHGGGGTDTIGAATFFVGPLAFTWNVTAANAGNVAGLVTAFRFIEVLSGGTGGDTFNVKAFPTGAITVRGGEGGDTLNYDAEGRVISGDTLPPNGNIVSTGVQAVPFTGFEVVNILNLAPAPITTDVDGDRKTDLVVFRPTTSTWFTLSSTSGFATPAATTFGQSGDVLVPGDYDGDDKIDFAVFRSAAGTWHIRQSSTGTDLTRTLGAPGNIPIPGDYDGDRKTDPAVYRPSTGDWLVLTSSSNYATTRTFAPGPRTAVPVPSDYDGDAITDLAVYSVGATWSIRTSSSNFEFTSTFQFGLSRDIPVPADYDGDGKTDLAVWRPVNGLWIIGASGAANATSVYQWGLPGDIPVPGDYDGDSKADLGVWRPSNGTWFIRQSTSTYATEMTRQWGLTGDVPLPNVTVVNGIAIAARTVANTMRTADFDGDGRADLNVYRPSNGTWFNLQSKTNYDSNQARTFQWGLNGDIPVSNDYDGDGVTDVAVWRPSNGLWFILLSSTSYLNSLIISWGLTGDVPVPGDYDGDGRADLAVWRPVNGQWFILSSSSGYTTQSSFQWGLPGDVPLAGDFDGDLKSDLTVFRPSTGDWLILSSGSAFTINASRRPTDAVGIPAPGDYDGDGMTDVAMFLPTRRTWIIWYSNASGDFQFDSHPRIQFADFGLPGDIPAPTDVDGDGRTDLVLWRPSTGMWFVAHSTTGFATGDAYQWGLNGDIPILPRRSP